MKTAIASCALLLAAGVAVPAGAAAQALDGVLARPSRADAEGRLLYLVQLRQAPLATYRGGLRDLAAPPRRAGQPRRLDVAAPESRAYVAELARAQEQLEARMASDLGRPVVVPLRFQHALNGFAAWLSADEARQLQQWPEVAQVEVSVDHPLASDRSPQFLGADLFWATPPNAPADGLLAGGFETYNAGGGAVLGVVESGINMDHPSFAAVDGQGHRFVNPNPGGFLGWCNPSHPSYQPSYACNGKLIGAWDFVDAIVPANSATFTYTEIVGPEDENGHGTLTSSVAVGNVHVASVRGGQVELSGIAPRAHLVMYDACYTRVTVADGSDTGLCPAAATTAAINQAVADGLVDALNYSISGGTQPWTNAESQALKAAVAAGIVVSASAGNLGPNAATVGHHEPWVLTVAATSHDRQFTDSTVAVLGPAPVPAALQAVAALKGSGPTPGATVQGTLRYHAANPLGCSSSSGGFPAGAFGGALAIIGRGGCNFSEKVANAAAAGALGVIVYNDSATVPTPMGTLQATSIPSVMVTQAAGLALRDFALAHPGTASASLSPPTAPLFVLDGAFAELVPAFSSRGPVTTANVHLLKPDVAAPGITILGAYRGAADSYEFLQGTSIAAPHASGAALLLAREFPTWSAPEIKSALMLSARAGQRRADGSTPADAHDVGSGLLDLPAARRVGLVLHVSDAEFSAANPASSGDTRTLNLPSLASQACAGSCSFTRRLRSVAPASVSYAVSFTGSGIGANVGPAQFTVAAGATHTLQVVVDASALAAGTYGFGTVVLTPTSGNGAVLRIPVAVRQP